MAAEAAVQTRQKTSQNSVKTKRIVFPHVQRFLKFYFQCVMPTSLNEYIKYTFRWKRFGDAIYNHTFIENEM